MDIATLLGRYIRHLRRLPTHHKRVHAFSVSGVITMIITVFWLHFHYGFWSSKEEEVYPETVQYEVRTLSEEEGTSTSPVQSFKNVMDELKSRLEEVPTTFKDTVTDTETFERQEN